MFKRLFIVVFVLLCPFWITGAISKEQNFLYEKEFNAILNHLLSGFWDESGDWKGDMMGDASWFATALLFQMGRDRDSKEFLDKAEKTAQWEKQLFQRLLSSLKSDQWQKLTDTTGGVPALFYTYQHTKTDEFKELAERSVEIMCIVSSMVSIKPPTYQEGVVPAPGPTAMFALSSFFAYLLFEETKVEKFRTCSLRCVDMANSLYWNDKESHYMEFVGDWEESTMLLALSGVYRITKDKKYLQHAKRQLETIKKEMWDKRNGGIRKSRFDVKNSKVLSGNNFFTTAMIEWYKATGDEMFLEYAKKTLNYILSPSLFDGKIIYHHFSAGEDRAKAYCTGCNFHTLYNIYELNKILNALKVSP